jgi:hypothetical protein
MASFAILAEGATDQVVLEEIIQTIYIKMTGDEVDVRYVQPIYDATSAARNENFGGWEMLLDFCNNTERMLETLSTNDYIVIQIDTDICEHKRIGLSRTTAANQLIQDMKKHITSEIPENIFSTYQERIIFAIAVHSTECWLLPLHAERKKGKSQTLNCEARLLAALATKNIKYAKNAEDYSLFSRGFRKHRTLMEVQDLNESLSHFIEALPKLTVTEEE